MSQVKKKCRRESFQVFLHVSKDIRFPSPSFDFIFKKKSPKILIATLFTELYKSWFLGLLNELQKILRNFHLTFLLKSFLLSMYTCTFKK